MLSITEYNTQLINTLSKVILTDYIKAVHELFYKDIDISFMDYSLKICQKGDEFCINPVEEFIKLGVKNGKIQSNQVKQTIERSGLIKGKDFELRHVAELRIQGGTSDKIIYLLKPDSFKKLLLDLNDHKQRLKFINYFALLEKCVSYYNTYQQLYSEKLLSGKDEKIDNLQKDIKEVLNQNNDLMNQNKSQHESIEKLMKYAKDTNDIVHELNIKVDELLKLIHKFLSNQINLLYTFNSNIDQTKVLIIYKLQNLNDNNKYQIVIRYCGLNMISNSINQFTKKKINTDYKIIKSVIIGAIQENIITIQSIYKNLDSIESINKQTIEDISNDESETIINDIFKIVNNNKLNLFVNKLEDNKVLKSHCDTMKHLTTMDNEFNNNINDLINEYLSEKLYNNKSFRVKKLCGDLKVIYDRYKN
jgi:hypothetical protein